MCGRYTLTTPGGRALAERFVVGDDFEPATLERYNVCPTEPIAVVAAEGEARVVHTVRWGLVPPWAHELGKGFQPINGKSETAADKAPFAELMARPERRCLVLADGWYEWLKAEKKGGDRIPFRYTIDDGGPFAFAGLWRRNRIAGELVLSACILTTAANSVCAPVHDRMPVVLAGPDEEAGWLAGEADGLLGPVDAGRTNVAPANPAVNKAGVEGAELLTPPPPSEPAQLSLDT
jgi:putative SOS response-associated peptidase YedK